MERDEHQDKLIAWAQSVKAEFPTDRPTGISNALYAYSELGLFDDLSIDPTLAIEIWAIVEKVRREGFPDELGM
jgi:hypothetical protein